jgi:hypothetical protein
LELAGVLGLDFITAADADGIAASIGPVKAALSRVDALPGEPSLRDY